MAYAENDSDEYLPDSDDSDDHDDHDERPNRWQGPPSTWQQLNSAEIDTLTALNELHNQDLSIHLYNAFALKHRHDKRRAKGVAAPAPNQDVNTVTGQPVQEDKWVPPNSWVAWPLPANVVPRPEFMKRGDAADEHVTFRMQTPYSAKAELKETISATILRLAKEKFTARQLARQDGDTADWGAESSDDEGSSIETGSVRSRARSTSRRKSPSKSQSVRYESTSEGERMDVDDSQPRERSSPIGPKKLLLRPVVATDDELSYTLLRPTVGGILANLDTTLAVLHNVQESRINCPSESEASDDMSSRSPSLTRSRSRGRGPSKNRSQASNAKHTQLLGSRTPSIAGEAVPQETHGGAKKRGRPKKTYPQLEGETERAYAIRIARLRKEAIPVFEDDDPEPVSDATPVPADRKTRAKPRARGARTQSRLRRRGSEASSDITSAGEAHQKPARKPRMARVRLRDWRDVLGAAALAGFPAPALDRAARRCADLFGQNFTLHTLQEGPPDQPRLDKCVRYVPGMPLPSLLEDSEDGGDEGPSQRLRAASAAPSEAEGRGRGRRRPTSVAPSSRSRSRSASAGGVFFCVVGDCPRAAEPFGRRPNLLRHMKLIHNYEGDALPVEVDSEDEMHGAVHVDGFLRPIRVRPGWRGEDAARGREEEKGKGRPRTRARKTRGETADTRMRDDANSTTGREFSD
ncbi:RNA polymerase I-specific transcription initiation factor-domain-containing protein [Xylaria palmicola]|nr:RNA polymerase I-specific transcription initiation factor-domain-containing protein [Xylaria palmicola]